jgi:hypothetical protein
MHFHKDDLVGTHYSWAGDGKHFYTGEPSRRVFDKFNGDQVLFLINFYGTMSGTFSVTEGRAIEQKIIHDLPSHAKSEISVFNWIWNTSGISAE